MDKTICFTIDIEPDFSLKDKYFGINDLPMLEEIVKKYKIKLTAFVTGKTLEENEDLLEVLRNMNAEIEQHSYLHQIGHDSKIDDIKKGIETHERIVGKNPIGYRAPQGIITKKEVFFLEEMGILFDSSIVPTFFPGRFNHMNFPVEPFKIKNSNIVEIPCSIIPKVKIPISLTYMQILGFGAFKFLFKMFGIPNLIVFDSHSYQLGKPPSYYELPFLKKIVYYRGLHYANPAIIFEEFVKYALSHGYESKYMIDVYNEIESNVPDWEFGE